MDFRGTYPMYLHAYGNAMTVTNVRLAELSDWREAIYIDMESPASSGISSVIQERPIEINPVNGGVVDFSYNKTRDDISVGTVYTHELTENISQMAGSHFIIYYADVAVVTDRTFMDESGYLSKVLQLSQLDTGAVDAANIIARRGREVQELHSITCAPDLRVEPGDKIVIGYNLSGSGRYVSKTIVVESVDLVIQEASYSMRIGGRKYVA
jgi:hypothetical protein